MTGTELLFILRLMKQTIELLAPAGDLSRLKTALYYGADAVYLGGKQFGLRARSSNFTQEQMKEAVDLVHSMGKKIYVTVNIFARNSDLNELKTYAKNLEKIGVDAVIVSDLGIMKVFKENTNIDIHISTQANICNKYTAMQYVELGATRVILARELSIKDIKEICEHLKGKAEVEVFVHGAMCISYSGRCLLSNYLTGRESNRGDCSQPCRYAYALQEEKRPGEFYPIEEDSHGTYIMNSKDLCLIEHIDELKEAGVVSFKIEGRMKSEYYVACVVNAYKEALAGIKKNFISELEKTAHRPFTTGFTFRKDSTEFTCSAKSKQTYEFVALMKSNTQGLIKNKVLPGDEIEILSPTDTNGKKFNWENDMCNTPETLVEIKCPYKLNANDILRKKVH